MVLMVCACVGGISGGGRRRCGGIERGWLKNRVPRGGGGSGLTASGLNGGGVGF